MAYTYEEFLAVANDNRDGAVKSLRDDLKFTEEGITQMLGVNADLCGTFFTKLIGQPFDASNEGHVTLVLEAAIKTPESIALTLEFLYKNFPPEGAKDNDGKPAKGRKARKKASGDGTGRRGREAIDWSKEEVPFKKGGKQEVVFQALLKFTGSRRDFTAVAQTALDGAGFKDTKAGGLIAHTVNDARRRGWNIRVVGENFVCERGQYVVPEKTEKTEKPVKEKKGDKKKSETVKA